MTDYGLSTIPVMKYMDHWGSEAWHNTSYHNKIATVNIMDHIDIPSNHVVKWDVSEAANGSVMGRLLKNAQDNTKYDLYIGGEGGVKANANSSGLFYSFMSLTSANLSYLDTSQVTNMNSMFFACINLKTLNLSTFDTSNIADIKQIACLILVR